MAGAWSLSEDLGVALAPSMATSAKVLRARVQARRRLDASTAGARATMHLLTLLPLAGLLAGFAFGLTPWEDPHNLDPRYTRVRVRTEVLPLLEDVLGGGVAESLARTAASLRADNDALDALAAAAAAGGHEGELLVASDARRKEVYWARYRCAAGGITPLDEPAVTRPADLPDDVRALATVGRGPLLYPDLLAHPLDLAGEGADAALLDVDAGVLAALAARRIAAGEEMPVEPLYLRRPDAVAPASTAPKSALRPSPRQQQRDLRQGERAGRGAEASQ